MKQPSEFAMKQRQEEVRPELRVGDWYNEEGGDQVARHRQVWGLLGFYHHNIIGPHLGFSGCFRRLWWQLVGWLHPKKEKRIAARKKLLSPWDLLEIRALLEERAGMDS